MPLEILFRAVVRGYAVILAPLLHLPLLPFGAFPLALGARRQAELPRTAAATAGIMGAYHAIGAL